MKKENEISNQIAADLLNIGAVKLSPAKPFVWASGLNSPIYCDNRVTLSYPEIRDRIRDSFTAIIRENFPDVEVIAGVATGGIAQGALLAQELNLPFVYIRSSQKAHGLENKIEGHIKEGQKVVIVEDLVSTGKSSLNAAKAIRNAKCSVLGMVAVFSYQLNIALENFENEKVELYTLTDYPALAEIALQTNYVNTNEMTSLVEWRKDPKAWSAKFE